MVGLGALADAERDLDRVRGMRSKVRISNSNLQQFIRCASLMWLRREVVMACSYSSDCVMVGRRVPQLEPISRLALLVQFVSIASYG